MWSFSRCFMMFFRYLPFVAWLLATLLLLRPARMGRRLFWLASVVLAALLARNFWLRHFGGSLLGDNFSELAGVVIGWGYMFGILLGGLAVMPPYRWWRMRAVAFAVLAAVLTSVGMHYARRLPDVNRYEVTLEGLPPSFDGLKLVQVSDLHCSAAIRRMYVQNVVDRVNALEPDIVCLTGDIVDGSPAARMPDLEPLSAIRSRYGVFGCSGNHEFYSGYYRWKPHFASLGINMLDNAHAVVTNGTDMLVIGGILDKAGERYFMDESISKSVRDEFGRLRKHWPKPDVTLAFSNAPPSSCRILLAHRPTDLAKHAQHGVRLQISGHTHGAAIWGLFWLPVAYMNDFHVNGFYREEGITLYVSPGSGQWLGYPIRLGVPSEIALLTLRAAH